MDMKNLFYTIVLVLSTILSCRAVTCLDDQQQVKWTSIEENVHGTNVDVEVSALIDDDGNYTEYGISIWDDDGNLIYENAEDVFSTGNDLNIWYKLSGLQPDKEYSYRVYVVYDGESYYSPYGNFTVSNDI